ncbi:putative (S)-2-haloacid dehalogenase [Candidatus Saccharimonas aalborgensis]|jgi:putative hydrolase of the HAD superfamily|uniref:Putative (S)-2-haloacid dehalogenase n=1 Tax=Candidatus Saccharimonas aalborgensis TaxID=1332188 RepID=R4PX26_9BACT|nr:HAD family phosphatase [Candidatus Saccharimonas aalborgensis]AGL62307.1 putative (S)-2-haloacid dehalogenase [Candidatus Saccharimonas aalborgensis]QQR51060.1 MAG: HAD family phosphatase [Candidatus Saccharibacteria bacterium]QQS68808.1 MAG: HAD family phosphatase [Candidatus Saccharibacteria bacterium]QQS71094.1 MAG: HAD family phosphatase [Candidatus Saccharibacteria bacterium]
MIRGIIFDCFGVLYEGSISMLRRICPPEKLDELNDLNKQTDYGYITTDEYIEGLARLLGKSSDEVASLVSHSHVRNQPLIDEVQRLKGEGYVLAMLSNVGNDSIERLFPADQLSELFDVVVLSYKEYMVKPHPAIFTTTAERMGLSPGQCVMIDDLATNCEGAEVAGMISIQHTSNDTTRELLRKILHHSD